MIRRIQEDEIDKIMPVVMEKACQLSEGTGLDPDYFTAKTIVRLCASAANRVCFINDDFTGIGMAREQAWPMDLRIKSVHEVVVAGADKKEIEDAIDLWAYERGINLVVVSCLERGDIPRVRRING